MDYFPAFIDVRQQRCLVIGGGEVAYRKAALLLRAQARLCVVAPALDTELSRLSEAGSIEHLARAYRFGDLDGARVVIAATDDHEVNATVARDANTLGVLVNVVDTPALCTFIVPALVDRTPVLVAISSSGALPVLARSLRGRIEAAIPSRYAELARVCAALRERVKAKLPSITQRRRFWEQVLESRAADMILDGDTAGGEREIARMLDAPATTPSSKQPIRLLGAGPGDPDLVSFRTLRALQQAEFVVCLPGAADAVADLSRRDARRWAVAEDAAASPATLAELVRYVDAGERVCVLAPGDAFRSPGGHPLRAALDREGIAYEVLPGVAITAH